MCTTRSQIHIQRFNPHSNNNHVQTIFVMYGSIINNQNRIKEQQLTRMLQPFDGSNMATIQVPFINL
jgi:hypothetical protein